MLRVDLVDDLEDQLLHHQRGRTGQIDPVIQVFGLRLLRVPDLLRDRLAQPRVDLNVREFHLLVDVVEVLAVKDGENVPLGEHSIAEVVLEPPVSGAQRALRALVALEALDPLDLFLALDLLVEFLTLATFFSQDVVVDLAFRFDRPRD